MAIYDLIILQTSQPVVITGSEKKTPSAQIFRFKNTKPTSSAQHIFFANPTTTEWLFGGYLPFGVG